MTRRVDQPDTDADRELRDYLSAPARGCFVMIAGAGSGKTTSLVKALEHIGRTFGSDLRARGQRVACIAYTEVAVHEIWGDVGNNPLFHVSTIHSFLWELARPFQSDIVAWVKRRMEQKRAELIEEQRAFGPRVQQKARDQNARAIARLDEELPVIHRVRRFRYGTGSAYADGILGHDDIVRMIPQLISENPLLARVTAQQYPFFFVDESQDAVPEVVEALRTVAIQMGDSFSVGFFGDPMQKIYVSGVGDITLSPGWKRIEKHENFRCPARVLAVINKIRSKGDGLVQTWGRHELVDGVSQPVAGTARLFILPRDANRKQNLDTVRNWLAVTDGHSSWTDGSTESDVRVLVIEHRMAAVRLGFAELHSAFKDKAPRSFDDGFRDGTAWPLRPFLEFLLPLATAHEQARNSEVIALLWRHSQRLEAVRLKSAAKPKDLLSVLQKDVIRLAELLSPEGDATVGDVLLFAHNAQLLAPDGRLVEYVVPTPASEHEPAQALDAEDESDESDAEKEAGAIERYFACPATQLRNYETYLRDLSPYSTQQGVKGTEFKRVLLVLDDDEGRHSQFSYDKLLGVKALSKTDIENQAQGKPSVLDRTRRLLYVCCSRATHDLAVALFAENVAATTTLMKSAGLFDPTEIYPLDSLTSQP
jgi:DNA helicase-2/ATP-dependent DNA helicase PcrA